MNHGTIHFQAILITVWIDLYFYFCFILIKHLNNRQHFVHQNIYQS